MIGLDDVRRVYRSGSATFMALDGITLDIAKGEFVALAGPSGSGKTTLLNLIGAIDAPTSGRVRVEGADLSELSGAARARLRLETLGFVFQHFHLVPVLSAAENVELPLLFRRELSPGERRSRVAAALDRVGLAGRAGSRPAQLSGGERQRVAIARAVAGRPAIVLADEPTASLDHANGAALVDLMRSLNAESGVTFVYATHDPELLRFATRIVTLRDGRMMDGRPGPPAPGGSAP